MTVVFIWLGSVVPEHYKKTYENCLANYNGNCKLIGEKEQAELTTKYNMNYTGLLIVSRADILRLLYLYEYGGIYLDLDSQINNWNFLKLLNCQNQTIFGQEQFLLVHESKFAATNAFICSDRQTPELRRLLEGIHPPKQQLKEDDVLSYASPHYLQAMNVTLMVIYPHIKHCYHNNWHTIREGCQIPNYKKIVQDRACFKNMLILGGSSLALLILVIAYFRWGKKEGNEHIRLDNRELEHTNLTGEMK